MIELDDMDLKMLNENFDDETISKIDEENVKKIFDYLNKNNIYYSKDLFITSLDLFLLPYDIFIERFENLKKELGLNYVDMLAEDITLIELMYK
jgi:hypothetical protein